MLNNENWIKRVRNKKYTLLLFIRKQEKETEKDT